MTEIVYSKVGNVFKNPSVSNIKLSDIPQTLQWISKATNIPLKKLCDNLLGSAGKAKMSSDLDIAIEPAIANDVYKNLVNRLGGKSVKINNGLKQIHFLAPITKTENFVQVDLMFGGNPELLKFTTASGGDKDYPYKGKDRAELFAIIVKAALAEHEVYEGDVRVARAGYVAINAQGLVYQYRILRKTKNGTYKKKMDHVSYNEYKQEFNDFDLPNMEGSVIDTKDEIVAKVFGKVIPESENPLDGYKDLYAAMEQYLSPEMVDRIKNTLSNK